MEATNNIIIKKVNGQEEFDRAFVELTGVANGEIHVMSGQIHVNGDIGSPDIVVMGNAHVVAHGWLSMMAVEDSTVEIHDSVMCCAWGNAHVEVFDESAFCTTCNNATATAHAEGCEIRRFNDDAWCKANGIT